MVSGLGPSVPVLYATALDCSVRAVGTTQADPQEKASNSLFVELSCVAEWGKAASNPSHVAGRWAVVGLGRGCPNTSFPLDGVVAEDAEGAEVAAMVWICEVNVILKVHVLAMASWKSLEFARINQPLTPKRW